MGEVAGAGPGGILGRAARSWTVLKPSELDTLGPALIAYDHEPQLIGPLKVPRRAAMRP